MAAKRSIPVDPEKDREFDKAFELFTQFVDLEEADRRHPVQGNAVYTTSVVLCMLVMQRMSKDSSLEAVVKKLLDVKPAFLPKNKRVTEGTLSSNTSSYSQARSRMPGEAARWLAERVSDSLIDLTQPSFDGRRVFLYDGTTITLAPDPELRQAFPPASNQHGEGVWPVALLTVAHELSSGAALVPEIGAMYGPNAVSETALMQKTLRRLPANSIVMADAGFGIFAVAHEVAAAGHSFVLRMTRQRFDSLTRKAELIEQGKNSKTWSHQWRPSAKERSNHPDLPTDAVLEVRLHEIVVHENLTLLVITDLPHAADALATLYPRRFDVEVDIRNLKVVLGTETIRARSVDTFLKELMASIVSYNLVTQFRRQAAKLADQPPRRMSFKRTWTTFRTFLLPKVFTTAAAWRDQYRKALAYAMQDTLPNRPGRTSPRETYPRRPKSNSFKKRTPKPPPS
jgi:hypothetical protein